MDKGNSTTAATTPKSDVMHTAANCNESTLEPSVAPSHDVGCCGVDATDAGCGDSVAERSPTSSSNFMSAHFYTATTTAAAAAAAVAASTTSLAESGSCPLSHQYHYIQYPAYYQQHMYAEGGQCHCPCSCAGQYQYAQHHPHHQPNISHNHHQQPQHQQQQQQQQHHHHQRPNGAISTADDSQLAVAVTVHRQAGGTAGGMGSEQSLLNHSYQQLQNVVNVNDVDVDGEEKPLNVPPAGSAKSPLNISCDCDLECTCGASASASASSAGRKSKLQQCSVAVADAMLGADEITVSESDNNSTMIKKGKKGRDYAHASNKFNSWCAHDTDKHGEPHYNSSSIDIDIDIAATSLDDTRPPLPPRPPPRYRNVAANANPAHRHGIGIKKYVVWCLVCGGFSCLLGVLFLGVYFLLHSYTITVGNFETVPTFVPATLLILTGLCIMSLARRKNRYSYLIKLSGACGLISALTCALVTVTTTVLHMSRLQALRECEYAQKTRTCTCYSDMIESQVDRVDKEGVRLVFDSLSDCGVVHGSLYSCLRAIFGLSVAGVLIAVFSCMLVYQLLSHERKKMYWEQLELRCRSLYTSQQGPPPPTAVAGVRGGPICRCCEQCHAHRQMPLQASTTYPWDDGGEPRFWTPGQPPGNFYSPNPGGDELHAATASTTCRGHAAAVASGTRSRATGWRSWPRLQMPWQRSSPETNSRFRQTTPSSPDSQYGFSNSAVPPIESGGIGSGVIVDEAATSVAPHNAQAFNVVAGALPYGIWGPPPPYSDPNSPARRGYYHYIQPNACNDGNMNISGGGGGGGNMMCGGSAPNDAQLAIAAAAAANEQQLQLLTSGEYLLSARQMRARTTIAQQQQQQQQQAQQQQQQQAGGVGPCCAQSSSIRNATGKRQAAGIASHGSCKSKGEYENTPSNTLPTRKVKKRLEAGAKSIGVHALAQPQSHLAVQQVFATAAAAAEGHCAHSEADVAGHDAEQLESLNSGDELNGGAAPACRRPPCKQGVRGKRGGVENTAFQGTGNGNGSGSGIDGGTADLMEACGEPAESEVYFADVSSCCNVSVKNDNYYYEDASHAVHPHHLHPHPHPHAQPHQHQHQHQTSNCSHTSNNSSSSNGENYLAQRFGPRENSIRSRLPFPQSARSDDSYDHNLNVPGAKSCTSPASPSATAAAQMQKEISRQSLCSVESEAQTEFSDLSPATPCGNKFAPTHFANAANNSSNTNNISNNNNNNNGGAGGGAGTNSNNSSTNNLSSSSNNNGGKKSGGPPAPAPPLSFVASFPYSSESQSLEAHRRSTKDIQELMLTPEAHYEVINDAPAMPAAAAAAAPFAMSSLSPLPSPHLRGSHKGSAERTTNKLSGLVGGGNLGASGAHRLDAQHMAKSRERLDVPPASVAAASAGIFPSESEWPELGGNRQRL